MNEKEDTRFKDTKASLLRNIPHPPPQRTHGHWAVCVMFLCLRPYGRSPIVNIGNESISTITTAASLTRSWEWAGLVVCRIGCLGGSPARHETICRLLRRVEFERPSMTGWCQHWKVLFASTTGVSIGCGGHQRMHNVPDNRWVPIGHATNGHKYRFLHDRNMHKAPWTDAPHSIPQWKEVTGLPNTTVPSVFLIWANSEQPRFWQIHKYSPVSTFVRCMLDSDLCPSLYWR